jgi:hypothetical protein
MRSTPTILTFALMAVMWTTVLWAMRQRRTRMAADPSARKVRSYRLHNVGVICATLGVTWFCVWLITDAGGPHWLHALSVPAALVFIAVAAAITGYAAWLGGP